MIVAIIGGKLQGIEAVFLAKEAGYYTILIDKNPVVPASGLCDAFVCGDITANDPDVLAAMARADFVLPANENTEVLEAVRRVCTRENIRLAFDYDAYDISSSKLKSDRLFHDNGIPAPRYFPEGHGPYIVKPSGESGSEGVRLLETADEVEEFLQGCQDREDWIAEEYLAGPSYSIEVIGNSSGYRTYTITRIHMDDVYDCCKVTAPCPELSPEQRQTFSDIGIRLAELTGLCGIMDVEVIDDRGQLKVLEIDARIPSQTPIAIYYATGVNFVQELAEVVMNGQLPPERETSVIHSVYEHYYKEGTRVFQAGEHRMGLAGPLAVDHDRLGAETLISDYREGCESFSGIFINSSEDIVELEKKREIVRKRVEALK